MSRFVLTAALSDNPLISFLLRPWRATPLTLRLRLVKLAARVVELKRRIKVHLPTSAPDRAIVRLVLGRLPRLVT